MMQDVRKGPVPFSGIPRIRGESPLPTAIVAAVGEELAGLRRRVEKARSLRLGDCRVECGKLGRVPVVLARTGEGELLARRGAEALLDRVPVGRLIVIGVGGGLSRSLPIGALLVATRVFDPNGPVPGPDVEWSERALRRSDARAGAVISTERVLCSPRDKQAVRGGLDDPGPAVVDLETAAIARVAASRGVPYVAVRAVSDTADETMPLDFNLCRDRTGRIRRTRVVRHALLHPSALRGLWQLQRRVSFCSERLAQVVEHFLDANPPRSIEVNS